MKLKSARAQLKAVDPAAASAGEFEAMVSIFGVVDSEAEVVVPGAFIESLQEWKDSGDQIPVLWSHRMDDPDYNIGVVVEAEELAANDSRLPDWVDPAVKRNGGLWVKGLIDTDPEASPKARQVARLLKQRRVTQFSFAYDVEESGEVEKDGGEVLELRKLSLYEVSPTQIGMNEFTELIDAKAAIAGLKVGRTLSSKNEESLRKARELLDGVLASLDKGTDEPAKSARVLTALARAQSEMSAIAG